MFHPLEPRRLLSAILLNNVITVTGTDSADNTYISFGPHSVTTYSAGITVNGQVEGVFEFYIGESFPNLIVNAQGGNDTVHVAGYPFASIQINGGAGNDNLRSDTAANILGGDGNDTLLGGEYNDTLSGGNGDDSLLGGGGDDWLDGEDTWAGEDFLSGGSGHDTIDYSRRTGGVWLYFDGLANDGVPGVPFTDRPGLPGENDNVASDFEVILLGAGDDSVENTDSQRPLRIEGGDGADILDSAGTLLGGAGDDSLSTNPSTADEVFGGPGTDLVDYYARSADLRISLDDVADDGAAGEYDNIHSDVEDVFIGDGDDLVLGSPADNHFYFAGGHDSLYGNAGNDTLDALWARVVDTVLLDGGRGHDTFVIRNDTAILDVRGGRGTDTIDYSHLGVAVRVSLDDVADDGRFGVDNIRPDVENIIGGSGNDTLIGNASNNILTGNDGNDTIHGGGGNDTLQGNAGSDYLYGEAGHDLLEPGQDSLFDYLDGGRGNDTLLTTHYNQIQDYLRRVESTQI